MFACSINAFAYMYSMRGIKSKTVGDGQHGTARWATRGEIKDVYRHINFTPKEWRDNPDSRPKEQGIADLVKSGYIRTEQRYRKTGAKSSLLFTVNNLSKASNSKG